MLVIALYTACFPEISSIKNFGSPYSRFGPSTSHALAPTLRCWLFYYPPPEIFLPTPLTVPLAIYYIFYMCLFSTFSFFSGIYKPDLTFHRNQWPIISLSSFEPDLVLCSMSVIPLQHRTCSVCMFFVRLGHHTE